MAAPQQQHAFPTELPARPGATTHNTSPQTHNSSFKSRACPNMRSCWSFSLSSFSLRTGGDQALFARRLCMLVTLVIRTAISILSCVSYAGYRRWVSFAINVVLAILGFFFIAWCLAVIGEARGWRKVLGLRVGRWHFDIFLIFAALAHIGILIGWFFGLGNAGATGTWMIMWLLIFGAAWVATWQPDEPASQV
ncbi:hypothetical protein BU24DRAFT_456907 [Aaosphaeria arxii CBS 175.79]|uniref:Uncharacterized protein n=1 Tax=Aaosphaeria arxii CBS 175.79 TaxID=1450172 RepID=A0A6A5Y7V1_9PLEO|nr:uncharacterized protein BU24DRAFT_456907 [Aaosphaeria arxii CBS 175.79]KAF2020880.1 hypothetical protein BU24DRAFT_456907 [Aaosphaeria arxii CBS 175.79]